MTAQSPSALADPHEDLMFKAPGEIKRVIDKMAKLHPGDHPATRFNDARSRFEHWTTPEQSLDSLLTYAYLCKQLLEGVTTRGPVFFTNLYELRLAWGAYNERLEQLAAQREAEAALEDEPDPPAMGTVYFIASGDYVKIGFTTNLESRLNALSTHTPLPPKVLASVPGTTADERALHERFKAFQSHREWFRLEGEVAAYIAEIAG